MLFAALFAVHSGCGQLANNTEKVDTQLHNLIGGTDSVPGASVIFRVYAASTKTREIEAGADSRLQDIVSYFDYGFAPMRCQGDVCTVADTSIAPQRICYLGAWQSVCDALRSLSARSTDSYNAGLHERAVILSCETVGGASITANFEHEHDWEDKLVHATWKISACSNVSREKRMMRKVY
jgi:hypothetical protein